MDSTELLDAWVRHSQTNSGLFMADSSIVYSNVGGNLDSTIIASDFGVEPMAYIDSIVNDSIIYMSGYYYHFIRMYDDEDLQLIYYAPQFTVNYWYPIDPNIDTLKMAYSIYIRDSTLIDRYDFECTSMNDLLDSLASMNELTTFQNLIYPNPGSKELNVKLDNRFGNSGVIQLYDAFGRLIHEVAITHKANYTLDIQNLKSGIYFVYLNNTNGLTETHKWIEQ